MASPLKIKLPYLENIAVIPESIFSCSSTDKNLLKSTHAISDCFKEVSSALSFCNSAQVEI